MNMNKLPDNLCLTFHCLYENKTGSPVVNQELFIHIDAIRKFCIFLKENEYNFCLPENALKGKKNCIVTFDDGYFNNSYFLKIAEELEIPFIIFLAGYNIENQMPFLWDLDAVSEKKSNYWKSDYSYTYNRLEKYKDKLLNDYHRPFSLQEISSLGKSNFVHFGYHGYYHQPFTFFGEKFIEREVVKSEEFMKKLNVKTINHFAFPNGLSSFYSKWKVKSKYDFIYTIDPGGFSIGSKFINRFSSKKAGFD